MKLTKEKIKKIFDSKELVFLIDKYISEWNEPVPEYIRDDKILHNYIMGYFDGEEDEILSYIDDYDSTEWDIHSSYYDFCDFLMDLKEHYKNNSDMEW